MKCVKVRTFSEVIRKKHNLEVYANCVQCELTPHWTDCCFIMIRFGSPERDCSLSKGGMTLKKGLRSQHSKDVQLHDSLGSPTSSKRPGKFSANKFSINA